MTVWWAERAWLGGEGTHAGVRLEVGSGRLVSVLSGVASPPPGAQVLRGLTLPGLANVHSHAFHRALRGRTHDGPGTFWTWRERMYEAASRLNPDRYLRLATAAFSEMVLSGYTAVGEFHYLHHGDGGVPYADPNEMGRVLIEAARRAGIRITLLDACYLVGGFGAPLAGVQLRFGDGTVDRWAERASALRPTEDCRIGAAIHSVRAVPPESLADVGAWAGERPLHAHVSEQRREVDDCRDHTGRTPLDLLGDQGVVDSTFTAVHGTHLTGSEIVRLGAYGGGCCLCPTTERDLGDGIGAARALLDARVTLSVGSDSHAVTDGFEEVRAVELDGRLAAERRGLISAGTLLEAATAGGMAALGWDGGRLEAGRPADFTTVRTDTPRTAGCDLSLAATAVYAFSAADVDTVVVGGRTVVSGGVHLAYPDLAAQLAEAIQSVWC